MSPDIRKIAIIGAGVSGLSAATELIALRETHADLKLEITVFDEREVVGGLLRTSVDQDRLIESSADMFTTKLPYGLQLCERIGYMDQLIPTNPKNRGARLATRDGLAPIPQGFSLLVPKLIKPILSTPILSAKAKARLLLEPMFLLFNRRFRPGDGGADESLESFATRHWGREVFETIIQPLVAGIYTADPAQLSMKAALEEFVELERTHGRLLKINDPQNKKNPNEADGDFQDSLSAGGKHAKHSPESEEAATGARYGLFLGPRHGMQHWMESIQSWLVERGVTFALSTSVSKLALTSDAANCDWIVEIENQNQHRFDAVVIATPAATAARLIGSVDDQLSEQLASIQSASAAIVVGLIPRSSLPQRGEDLKFGIVVPESLGRPLIACSFGSNKFPGRCHDDEVLVRCFFGGALHPELLQLADDELKKLATTELSELLDAPELQLLDSRVVRWNQAMPQYQLGHLNRIEQIESRVQSLKCLAIAGNAYRGVGIPQCIKSGFDAARKVIDELQS